MSEWENITTSELRQEEENYFKVAQKPYKIVKHKIVVNNDERIDANEKKFNSNNSNKKQQFFTKMFNPNKSPISDEI